jgi:hypothetical protein
MNSEERRAARRKRREEKRAAKRAQRNEGCTLEDIADLNALYKAAHDSALGVSWKSSVQRYRVRLLRNLNRTHHDLLDGNEICRPTHDFTLYERGKRREISAVCFPERVAKKSFNQNALVPTVMPTLIAGNSANVKGRGTEYAIKRIKKQLAKHYQKHGAEGYILLVDLSNYFGSIDHEYAKKTLRELTDPRLRELGEHFIDRQGEVGLGLGDEPNQTHAIAFMSPIDHFVAECCGVEAYGRYMDDLYALDVSKERLQLTLGCIEALCHARNVQLNPRKTQIVKLTRGFRFLKKRFTYTSTGKIIVRPARQSITRERRKLKKQAELVSRGLMTMEQVEASYQSWRASVKKLNADRTLQSMDALYRDLFEHDQTLRGGVFKAKP